MNWKKALRAAFPVTLPVLAGYLALGIAYGLLLVTAEIPIFWAPIMSVLMYAGSGQFLAVSLIAGGATLIQAALLTCVLHFRHLFYGLSLIERFHGAGKRKAYLIFGLTDETYALLASTPAPPGVAPPDFYLAVTLLNHLYWIAGGVIGSTMGALIAFDTTGVDFAMTALFVVLLIEQVKKPQGRIPAVVGGGCALVSLLCFGADRFLIPALIALTAILLIARPRLERGETPP